MAEPLLCALDLTEDATRVASYTKALADVLGAPLHGVHVFEVPESPLPTQVATALESAEDALQAVLAAAGAPEGTRHLHVGQTSSQILATAQRIEAGLVVMSSRARGTVPRVVLGSTAEAVLKNAARPVLVLPQGAPWNPPRTVVVASDPDEPEGLQLAARLSPNAEVHVVHALGPDDGGAEGEASPLHRRRKADAASRINGQLKDTGWSEASVEVVSEEPLAAVRGVVQRVEPDLVVVGRSQRSVLARVFSGTTSVRLLREATTPVLMVPAR